MQNYNDQVKEDEMGIKCRTHEEKNAYEILVGKPEGKRQLVRSRRRWEGTIQTDGVVWTGFFWLRIGTRGGLL
jgi:hypothetical protein